MIDNENSVRQKFLLGLSLSEISFIYFIIILLISLNYISDYKKKNEEISNERDELKVHLIDSEARIAKLQGELGMSKEERERSLKDRRMDVRKITDEMNILKKDKEKLDKLIIKKEKLKLDNMTLIVILEEFSEIMKQMELYGSDNGSLAARISDLVAKSEKYESYNEELKEELEELEKDLELTRKESTDEKGEGDRHGPPPCFFTINEKVSWKDKKKEDYMYNVSINVNNFDLKPVWKTKDSESMKTIWKRLEKEKDIYKKSFALSRNSFRLNKDQFARFGAITDKHAEENECKHYVRIIDKITNNPKTTIEDLKKLAPNRVFVERYFYKYEVPLKKTK